ncbi:ATP-binding protein [Paenibacillus sp. TRM 82003]|nr:ATP-binding protein [Paenibacillus sp. TRM 82003]
MKESCKLQAAMRGEAVVMSRRNQWIIAIFIVVMAIRGWSLFVAEAPTPTAEDGVLDLREWSLETNGSVRLVGEWAFHPSVLLDPAEPPSASGQRPMLLQVPGPWNEALSPAGDRTLGYGTYRLRVLLSEADRERMVLAIRSGNIRSSHELFVSGMRIGGSGTPGTERASTSPQNTPYVVEMPVRSGELLLTVHTANFHYGNQGGIFDTFQLGTVRDIMYAEQSEKLVEYFIGGAFGLLCILFLLFYGFRRNNPELLWFGLFFLSYLTFGATHGEKLIFVWWPTLPYEWQSKIQFLSSLSIYLSMLHFVRHVFPRFYHPWVLGIANGIGIASALFCLFTDVLVFSSWELPYIIYLGVLSVYLTIWLLAGVITRNNESVYVLIGALSLFYENFFVGITFLGIQPSNFFFPIEMLLFVASMGVLLAKRFFDNLKQVELASERLVRADRMKSEFLANTSHELRTPLHGMINMAQVTLDEGGLDANQGERLRLIVSTGRKLSHLLEDILDLSKLNEGTLNVSPKAVDVRSAAASVWELLPYVTEDRRAKLENRIPPALPKVWADDQRFMQILFNLLHNAIKHADARVIAVEAEAKGAYLEIAVSDDGKGIPPERLEGIFSPFHQVGSGADAPTAGAGLGLAIAKRLVELQGGALTVQSEPNRGTTFRFTLPAAQFAGEEPLEAKASVPKEKAWKPRSETPADSNGAVRKSYPSSSSDALRLLVVEDDPVSQKVVCELLTNEGYAVDAVSDGDKAMHALSGSPRWDAVVLDISLPGKNGYELCRSIRERFSFHELPVLFLTARSQPADLMAGFDAGANDYVLKPVDATELRARVRTLLHLKQSVRDKLRIEMALIQAQIKPHFLFNALNTIASLSETDPDRMREVLTDFGLYLKNSFDLRNLDKVVPFAMEWSLVESYLSVERARFGHRMRIETRIPEHAAFELPPLSIQPIVENALRHGVLKRPEGGAVRISVEPLEDRVKIVVADDGVGFPEGTAEAIARGEHKGGIGLTNIHRRLMHMYGKGLSIRSKPGEGATITFDIPLGKEREDEGLDS